MPSPRSSKSEMTDGCTSSELSQRVKTRASRSPSASKSSTCAFSSSVMGSRPGWVLKRLATKARFSFGFPATREVAERNLRQSSLSAFSRTCSARWWRSRVWRGERLQRSGANWFRRIV